MSNPTRKQKIVVKAYIPPLQSAIMVDGAGDTMQVKITIPLRESPEGLLIQTLTQKRLQVTFQELSGLKQPQEQKQNGARRKQRYPYH